MENQYTNSTFDLSFNENLKTQIKGTAAWAGIAGILYIVIAVLGVLNVFVGKKPSTEEYEAQGIDPEVMAGAETAGNIVSIIITLVLYSLMFYFLNKFATRTKTGLNGNNSQLIGEGLGGLSSYYIFVGILIIIGLAFMTLAFLGALAVGLTS